MSGFAFSQSADSLNMTAECRWDNDNLPSRSGAYFNDIWGYADGQGNEVAIMGGIQDIFFIDVNTCTLIDSVHVFDEGTTTDNHSLWRDFKTYQNYAYAVADERSSGLIIFDLSNIPNSVSQVYQSTAFFAKTHNIFIDEANARLYVAGSNTRSNGLIVLDISGSNATNPQLLASVSLAGSGGYVHDVFVKDNIAYASHGNNGLTVYEFSDPTNPKVMGTYDQYPEEGYNHSSWVNADNTYLVFADETFGKSVKRVEIDINMVDTIITFGNLELFKSQLESNGNSIAHNPFIKGDMVYISYYHDGIQIFDISQPNTVTRHAYYDTEPSNTDYSSWDGAWGVYPFLPSGKILASDQLNGFYSVQMMDQILAHESMELATKQEKRSIRLDWQTISNRENASFKIEHQQGSSAFEQVGILAFDPIQESYQFIHQPGRLIGKHNYRISFISEQGETITTRFSSIDVKSPSTFKMISNLPNDQIQIEGPSFIVDQEIQLFNLEGKLVKQYQWVTGMNQLSIDVNGLTQGMYILRWTDGIQQWVHQFAITQ
jgi:choice-of-anchor B domain-containing protein